MEISPIPGIRILPVAKVRPVDPQLKVSPTIESTARPDDDTYSFNDGKAADDEGPEEETTDAEEVEEVDEPATGKPDGEEPDDRSTEQIDIFA